MAAIQIKIVAIVEIDISTKDLVEAIQTEVAWQDILADGVELIDGEMRTVSASDHSAWDNLKV